MPKSVSRMRATLLATAALLVATPVCFADGLSATATYTDTQVSPGLFDYNVTLNNTGTTTIGTFWFAWVPGAGFLSPAPSSISDPSGWTHNVTNAGAAIQWVTTDPIAAGETVSGFNFESTETPEQLLGLVPGTGPGAGDVITTSFVYIGAPLRDPGFLVVPQPSAVAATPEPGSFVLMLTGVGLAGFAYRSRFSLASAE